MDASQDSWQGEKGDSKNSIDKTKEVPEGSLLPDGRDSDTVAGQSIWGCVEEAGHTSQDLTAKGSDCWAQNLALEYVELRRFAFQKAKVFRKN